LAVYFTDIFSILELSVDYDPKSEYLIGAGLSIDASGGIIYIVYHLKKSVSIDRMKIRSKYQHTQMKVEERCNTVMYHSSTSR